MAEVAVTSLPSLVESSRESSKHKHATNTKKRQRDSSHADKADKPERKHKKSRSDAVPSFDEATETVEDDSAPKKKKGKSHKSSKKTQESHLNGELSQDEPDSISKPDADDGDNDGGEGETRSKEKKKKSGKKDKKDKKDKKKSKKSKKTSKEKHDQVADDDDAIIGAHGDPGVVVLASSRSKAFPRKKTSSSSHRYPFYTQTVAQYLPLHPLGSNEPMEGYINQHLEPLLNRYVPALGGVLLAYRNPRVGEAPGSSSLTEESAMEDVAVFESINEYAVNYAWLTADIDLFQPSRGAWLEGLVNIQTEGHIGVVCWRKFNASIESGRLPPDWQWVDQQTGKEGEDAGAETASPDEGEEGQAETDPAEVHMTGYWVDGEGKKIASDVPIRFRITNYEVGSSGDYGYLSIEGTMLLKGEEEKKVEKEMETLRRKARRGAPLRRDRRAPLDSSITKFGEDAKEPDSQQAVTPMAR